jgi:hypothetical protein
MHSSTFDRVVVSANLGTLPILTDVDPKLDRHLMGMKGYGLAGHLEDNNANSIEDGSHGRAVHYIDHGEEFQAAYARSTGEHTGDDDANEHTHRVKIWGGHDASLEPEYAPPYPWCDTETETHIFREGPACAQDLIELNTTSQSVGMRPLPSLGQIAMIKRYGARFSTRRFAAAPCH